MQELTEGYKNRCDSEKWQKRTTYAAKMRKGLTDNNLHSDIGYWIRNARNILNRNLRSKHVERGAEIYVGLEFECPKGHRFILDYPSNSSQPFPRKFHD